MPVKAAARIRVWLSAGRRGIKSKGEIRKQYTHLIDVGPTILEAVGIPEPKMVNGVEQIPMAGTSMIYSFDDAAAKDRHIVQYNECSGNRSIYKDGWMACVMHRAPWESSPRVDDYAKDKWELYHVAEDFGQATDLAAQNPAKLKELQDLFHQEAIKFGVYPMDDRSFARLNATNAGRPDIMAGRTEITYYAGMTGMAENVFIDTLSRSYVVTADLVIPKGGATAWSSRRRSIRWLEPLCQGRQTQVRLQLVGAGKILRSKARKRCRKERSRWSTISPMTAAACIRAVPACFPSTARKSAKDASIKRKARSGRWPGRPRTSARTPTHRSCDDYDPWDNAFTGTINTVKIKHKA